MAQNDPRGKFTVYLGEGGQSAVYKWQSYQISVSGSTTGRSPEIYLLNWPDLQVSFRSITTHIFILPDSTRFDLILGHETQDVKSRNVIFAKNISSEKYLIACYGECFVMQLQWFPALHHLSFLMD